MADGGGALAEGVDVRSHKVVSHDVVAIVVERIAVSDVFGGVLVLWCCVVCASVRGRCRIWRGRGSVPRS